MGYDVLVRKFSVFLFSILVVLAIGNFFLSSSYAAASLPPCAKWAYAFPTNSPNFKLNNSPIPTSNPEYVDPDFTTRKCIEVQTGIGNISTEPQGLIRSIFGIVLGLAGGIALIMIMISGYRFMVSQGNPEALAEARGYLISAIVGLLFIILSFVILQIIGVDILKIPGFNP